MLTSSKPGLIDRMFRSIENPAQPITAEGIIASISGGQRSRSGVMVTPQRMMEFGPIWQGVGLLGGDTGRTPCICYKKDASGRGRKRATNHPTHKMVRRNVGQQTANLFWSAMVSHAALFGNSYAIISRGGAGFRPTRMEFTHSDLITPRYEKGVRFYTKRNENGTEDRLRGDQVYHLPGLVLDQLGGLSLVRYARDTIGAQIAAAGYGDDFFSNNAIPHGFFRHPETMSADVQERFMSSILNRHGGPGRQFKSGILEEGMSFEETGISPNDALLVDFLNIGPRQAANYLNVPPHKVGDNSRTSYKSLEEEGASYIESSLGVWWSKCEFEANDKLFRESEKSEYYVEFLADARFRGDIKTRFSMYALAIQWGIMSPNECRERENLNPYNGGDLAKVYFSDGQGSSESDGEESVADDSAGQDSENDDERDFKMRVACRDVLFDRMNSMTKRLVGSARTAAKKPETFGQFVNSLRDKHGEPISDAFRPACQMGGALYDRDAGKMTQTLVDEFIDNAAEMFLEASECSPDELHDRVTNVTAELTARASQLATETICE